MRRTATAALVGAFAALCTGTACGDEQARIVLTVDLSGYSTPDELDIIRVETTDATDPSRVIGRNFPIESAMAELEVVLIKGTRITRDQILTVHGYLGTTLVVTSEDTPVRFRKGELKEVRIEL